MLLEPSPVLLILSGPSGVGKDTIIRELKRRYPDVHYAVTATTRAPRAGEINGREYVFLSRDRYDQLLDRGELLAPAQVHGHWYGAPLEGLRRAFAAGKDVLLKIDVQGAIQVRRAIPQAVFIFVAPPSMDHLIERLRLRHTESRQDFELRIRDARFEMAQLPEYDYAVVNRDDDVDRAVQQIACILTAERLRVGRPRVELHGIDTSPSRTYTRLDGY